MASRENNGVRSELKAFLFGAQVAHVELERIERELGIELDHSHSASADTDEEYYPQFDEDLRREAAQMAAQYQVFYCLEKSIRRLITNTLKESAGAAWWDSGKIPPLIHSEVARRMQREVDSAVTVRSASPLDFTTFGELGEIIKANWGLFGGVLNSPRAVERVLNNLNVLRGPIAHCSPLADDEVLRLELSLRDWFRQMA